MNSFGRNFVRGESSTAGGMNGAQGYNNENWGAGPMNYQREAPDMDMGLIRDGTIVAMVLVVVFRAAVLLREVWHEAALMPSCCSKLCRPWWRR
jgi:hypothetical protein